MHNAGLLLAMFLYLSLELALLSVQSIALLDLNIFPIEAWSVLCDEDIWPAPHHSARGWPIEHSIPALSSLSSPPK